MNNIIFLVSILALSIPLIAFINLKTAIFLCITFEILVPHFFNFSIIGIPLPFRFIYIITYVAFVLKYKKNNKSIDYSIIKPFLYLLIPLLLIVPFQTSTPIIFQLNQCFRILIVVILLPTIIWNEIINDPLSIKYIKGALLFSTIIACVYGIILMGMPGINPYLMLFSNYFNNAFSESYALAENQGRIFGRIQSTFQHPMQWSLFLCFAFSIFFIITFKEKNKKTVIILILIIVNILLSGVRTGIIIVLICIVYFLIKTKKTKYILIFGLLGLIISIISIKYLPTDVTDYLSSIIDFSNKKQAVSGSSLHMRNEQLQGSFDIISESISSFLFGNGFGWNMYYLSLHGDHPVLLAFESLLFVVICNSGIVGCLIWIYFIINLFKFEKNLLLKNDVILINMIVLTYFTFAIITGEYDYLQMFAIYYSITIGYLHLYNKNFSKK